jgi:hypothetical protein
MNKKNLKEDSPMDATTTLSTQLILTSALLGFLVAWMVTFAVLALRSYARDAAARDAVAAQNEESANNVTPASSTPAPLQMMAIPPSTPNPVQTSADRRGNTGEMEAISVG